MAIEPSKPGLNITRHYYLIYRHSNVPLVPRASFLCARVHAHPDFPALSTARPLRGQPGSSGPLACQRHWDARDGGPQGRVLMEEECTPTPAGDKPESELFLLKYLNVHLEVFDVFKRL